MTNNATFIFIEKEKALNALRVNSLFYHLSVDLSVSIFSFYTLQYKTIPKKVGRFSLFFRPFLKFYKNQKLWDSTFPGVMNGPTQSLVPISALTFIVYKLTNKQSDMQSIYIDDGGIISVLVSTDVSVWDY